MNLEPLRELEKRWRIQGYQIGQGPAGNKARRKCADELAAAIAQLDDGWRPIAEADPHKEVLLFYPPLVNGRGNQTNGVYMRIGYPNDTPRKPTHFRPLPSPPEQVKA